MSLETPTQSDFHGAVPPDWNSVTSVESVFDEFRHNGRIRKPWAKLIEGLNRLGIDELRQRYEQASRQLLENGVSYHTFSSEATRPWELDLIPHQVHSDDWQKLTVGLKQRATLLNRIVADLHGEQSLLNEGLLPREVVFGHPNFRLSFHGLPAPRGHLQLCGFELARSPHGQWFVMADRTANPYGTGYALENRLVISRALPDLMQKCRAERLAPFFISQQKSLHALSPRKRDEPQTVLLSSGPDHPYYFEDAYLARYLGLPLVESGDLAVRNNFVWIKTLNGLVRVDVILRRIPEVLCDPLELGGRSPHGIPGLIQAVRSGNVAITNSLGSGLLESPVFMAFLPALCQRLLSEELIIPSIATWWCGNQDARGYVLKRLDELVIKPAYAHSGGTEVFVDELTSDERKKLVADIEQRPHEFLAQERVRRSTAPVFTEAGLAAGHMALRTFLVSKDDGWEAMSGALVRVQQDSGPMELSVAAGSLSKDLWVRSDHIIEPVSLLQSTDEDVRILRGGENLPSRVADHLYWLGRELERSESLARLLRAMVDRLAQDESKALPELSMLLRALAHSGPIEPGYAIAELEKTMPAIDRILPRAIFDAQHDQSLRSNVEEVHRLASVVRDRISYDTWRIINRIEQRFRAPTSWRTVETGEALIALDRLITDLAACSGLASDAMTRDAAWRFLDIGQRIQQTLQQLGLLRCTLVDVSPVESTVLEALLDVAACRSTYRSRYYGRLHPAPVIDLLLSDDTHPRSVVFQLRRLSEHIDSLPSSVPAAEPRVDQRLALDALHQVRMSEPRRLIEKEDGRRIHLEALIDHVEKTINSLADVLSRTYLIHAGPLRQMD